MVRTINKRTNDTPCFLSEQNLYVNFHAKNTNPQSLIKKPAVGVGQPLLTAVFGFWGLVYPVQGLFQLVAICNAQACVWHSDTNSAANTIQPRSW